MQRPPPTALGPLLESRTGGGWYFSGCPLSTQSDWATESFKTKFCFPRWCVLTFMSKFSYAVGPRAGKHRPRLHMGAEQRSDCAQVGARGCALESCIN